MSPTNRHAQNTSSNPQVRQITSRQLDHNDISASLFLGSIGNEFACEFRFRFKGGRFIASTMPLTAQSRHFISKHEALADAAKRLLICLKNRIAVSELSVRETSAVVAIRKWVAQFTEDVLPLDGTRFVDAFAGIGGFHLALTALGSECAGAIEIDRYARDIYRANHPGNYLLHEDIRDAKGESYGRVDLLCGGFPCTHFSGAGDGAGFEGADGSGQLFFEILRLISESSPSMVLLENVDAIGSHDNGRTMDRILDELTAIGYAVSTEVLNAANFGLAQQRERLFIVGIHESILANRTTPFVFPKGSDSSVVVADILGRASANDRCAAPMQRIQSAPKNRPNRIEVVGFINGKNSQGYRVASSTGKGFTLCANSGGPGAKTGLYLVSGKPRRLTPRECARMQGFPEAFSPHSKPAIARRQFGNSVAVPVVSAIATQLSKSIR